MNKSPESKNFWRLCGPLILYFVIEYFAQMLVSVVMIAPQLVRSVKITADMTTEDVMQAYIAQVPSIQAYVQQYAAQIAAVLAVCTMFLTVFLFWQDRKKEKQQQIPVREKAAASSYVWLLILGTAVCLGCNALAFMTELAFASESYQQTSAAFYSPSLPVQIICLGIVVPLGEELMFRGVLYKRCRETMSFAKAAIYSALLFGLMHGNLVQMLYGFALGAFLALVYERYGTFFAPVLLHIFVNVLSLLCTELGVFNWMVASVGRMSASIILSAFVGSVMFVMIQRMKENEIEKGTE